jgi:hypothetical protein
MPNDHVSLILNMYNEVESANEAIQSFATFYPNSRILVAGSEILPLSQISCEFNFTSIHTNQYIGPLHEIEREEFRVSLDEKFKCIFTQILNLQNSFEKVDSDYVYYLHPDHRVVKYFDFNLARFDLEILMSNRILEKEIAFLHNVFPNQQITPYYGIWGYFKTSAMVSTLRYLSDEKTLLKFISASDLFIYDDLLIPAVMQGLGFSVGSQSITWELRRRTLWPMRRKAVLIHHYPSV